MMALGLRARFRLMWRSQQARELVRFLVTGGGSVTVDFGVYFLLLLLLPGVSPSAAKATSFVTGACFAFLFNRGFVFRSKGDARRQAVLFTLLYAASGAV